MRLGRLKSNRPAKKIMDVTKTLVKHQKKLGD